MSKKTTELTVRIAAALLLVICVFSFAACGNKGIEGTWVLIEEYEADGKKISSEELEDMGISETYVIENGEETRQETDYTEVCSGRSWS